MNYGSSPQISVGNGSTSQSRSQSSVNLNIGPDTHSFMTIGQDSVHLSGLGGREMNCTRHASVDGDSPSLGSLSTFGTDRVTLSNLGQEVLRCRVD